MRSIGSKILKLAQLFNFKIQKTEHKGQAFRMKFDGPWQIKK